MNSWFILFCLLFSFNLPAQDLEHLRTQINNIIDYDSETPAEHIPHLLVGILMDEKKFYLDFGRNAQTSKIDSSTLFEIGDISKIFTALLALEIENRNHFSSDSSINKYLLAEYQSTPLDFIRPKDLLMHQAGLSKLPAGIGEKEMGHAGIFANYTKADLWKYCQKVNLSEPYKFEYSHTGYALVEVMLENILQEDYYTLLNKYILEPYGLQHTFLNTSSFADEKLLIGHNLAQEPIQRPSYSSFGGSLGVVSSAADLLELMRKSWTNPSAAYQKSLVEFQAIPKEKNLEIGYGWHRIVGKRYDSIYLHTGKTEGFRSYMAMVPNTKTAVVVLSNSKLPQNGLGYYILKMINFGWKKRK